jgi:hypothetical protein
MSWYSAKSQLHSKIILTVQAHYRWLALGSWLWSLIRDTHFPITLKGTNEEHDQLDHGKIPRILLRFAASSALIIFVVTSST